jgi:hypothetical protein
MKGGSDANFNSYSVVGADCGTRVAGWAEEVSSASLPFRAARLQRLGSVRPPVRQVQQIQKVPEVHGETAETVAKALPQTPVGLPCFLLAEKAVLKMQKIAKKDHNVGNLIPPFGVFKYSWALPVEALAL